MVRGEIKLGEKVRAEDSLTNIGNGEFKCERAFTDDNCLLHATITINFRSISGTESEAIWAVTALGGCGRDYRQEGAAVDEPFVTFQFVRYVKE